MTTYFRSVSGKLILAAGLAITLIMVGFSSVNAWRTYVREHDQTMEFAFQEAQGAAAEVSRQMVEAIAASAALSGVIEGYLQTGSGTKSGVIDMLELVTLKYANLYSAWMSGLEDRVVNDLLPGEEGLNAAGIFTPYWTRNDSNGVSFSSFDIGIDQEWYAFPLTTGQSIVTEPYKTSEGIMMTSVSMPVRHNDEIVGLVGVDITLANMVALLAGMETFEGGEMMLVDNAGKWAANPDLDLLATVYEGLGEEELDAALADGQPRVIQGFEDQKTRLVYPFSTPGMGRTWAVILDVPIETFTAPVRSEVIESSLTGLTILALVLAVLFIASSRMVQRPLAQMLKAINSLAARDYDISLPSVERHDEMGAMAISVSTLRRGLLEKDALEAEQVQLRQQAEAAREQQIADETRIRQEREERRLADQARDASELAKREDGRRAEKAENSKRASELSSVIGNLADGLRGLATGNLEVSISAEFPNAYEQLRLDFNNTVTHLVSLVSSISTATHEIVGGTQEISRATTDLSRQTEHSAASLEETAAALNELTASVKSAATSSRNADALVRETSQKANATTSVLKETVTAMEAIKDSSDRISKIIDVIDDIAFQTNLLALNAGVEAARAGEAGRGFAVVASEVRELSQRSSAAAREIDDLISQSSSQVLNGVSLVGRTGDALDAILKSVGVIATHVGEIASSADEQATGLSEINSAVAQLDRVQQQSAATFEETSAACVALDNQASELSYLVGQFSFKKQDQRKEKDQEEAA
jgi:methyl-accepting chemotaxis protein